MNAHCLKTDQIQALHDGSARRRRVVAAVFVVVVHINISVLAFAAPAAARGTDGDIVSRAPLAFPFETYDEWLAFMDRSPDPAWRAGAMRALFDEETFNRYKRGDTVSAEKIAYLSDGLRINGYLVAPKDKGAKAPVILFAHGGVGEWGRITFFDILEFHRLAEEGYVVIASALRGEGGSEGEANMGAGDRADMLNLIRLADALPFADAQRLGLWGFSRGGALGYRVIAATDRIDAALLVGAPSDLVNAERRAEFDEFVYPDVVDNYAADKDAALKALSAVFWPEKLHAGTAIALVHGGADLRVETADSLEMAAAFERLGRPYQLLIIKDGSHALIEHHLTLRRCIDEWFAEHLLRENG